MEKAKIYNLEGNIVGDIELPSSIFGIKVDPELIHEAVRVVRANARNPIAHTKTRGEVSGGGKKPWKQKGTGRARHGSIRSPIWKGGGVTFGPRNVRNFSLKMNRVAKRQAFLMSLTDRAENNKLVILENLVVAGGKTKEFSNTLAKLPVGKKNLVILATTDKDILRASKNLPKVTVRTANAISIIDVLNNDTLVMPKASLEVMEKLYSKK